MKRFGPVDPGKSPDPESNQMLDASKTSIWADFRFVRDDCASTRFPQSDAAGF
jgi:hypothetical protein